MNTQRILVRMTAMGINPDMTGKTVGGINAVIEAAKQLGHQICNIDFDIVGERSIVVMFDLPPGIVEAELLEAIEREARPGLRLKYQAKTNR